MGGTSPSGKRAETQPDFPRPYAVGSVLGSASAIAPDCGSLHEMEKGSPSTLR